MIIDNWLASATKELQAVGIGTARLDALVLLEDCTGHDRAYLLAHPDLKLSPAQQSKLTNLLNRRASHEPLAYVRGQTEFYGRNFVITPAVLEPRPESETMIELLLKLEKIGHGTRNRLDFSRSQGSRIRIADVGSGSGALGITAKLELPAADVDLIDIDDSALKVSKMNVDLFTINISVIKSDLLASATQAYDILLCNLPYVPDGYHINPAAGREPRIAIFGGADGLDIYRKLFEQLKIINHKPLYILTESLPPQHDALKRIAAAANYQLCDSDDFIQVFTRQLMA